MRTMHDSVTASNIPTSAQMVAGYIDGMYAWSLADWQRFPGAIKVRIAVFASTNAGTVLDVERGDATPAQAVGWVQRRRAAGVDPTVYCGYSTNGYSWALVIDAFKSAGVPEPHYWIAAYPGIGANLYPGSVAHQYANPGPYDLSVVADYWPGVDSPLAPPGMTTVGNPLATGGTVAGIPTIAPLNPLVEDDMFTDQDRADLHALIATNQNIENIAAGRDDPNSIRALVITTQAEVDKIRPDINTVATELRSMRSVTDAIAASDATTIVAAIPADIAKQVADLLAARLAN